MKIALEHTLVFEYMLIVLKNQGGLQMSGVYHKGWNAYVLCENDKELLTILSFPPLRVTIH